MVNIQVHFVQNKKTRYLVFKVYKIEEDKFREICNLRASKHLNLSFSCNDVSWSWTDGSDRTCCDR